jgi:hypothetical protein
MLSLSRFSHVISFHFKAHPRFLEAASFAWPQASWHFMR